MYWGQGLPRGNAADLVELRQGVLRQKLVAHPPLLLRDPAGHIGGNLQVEGDGGVPVDEILESVAVCHGLHLILM